MLHGRYPVETLRTILTPRDGYRPHPTIEERERWAALPQGVASAHVAAAAAGALEPVEPLPATLFLRFSRDGDRRAYERIHFARRAALEQLVVGECIEAEGRFLDSIVDLVWAICEETYWGLPAHVRVQRAGNTLPDVSEPTVDLFAAETANLLAWTCELLGARLDAVSPLVRPRIVTEIERRVLRPLCDRDDFWWMGFELPPGEPRVNNWNPWICSNWLAAVLLMEADQGRRAEAVAKVLRTVDRFIDPYPQDGGCDEGPGYWGRAGASVFDVLDLLFYASAGAIDVYAEPKIRQIGRFIYRAHISGDYYVNFADAPALVQPDGALVHAYGRTIGDPQMADHGAWLVRRARLAERGYADEGRERPVNLQRLLRGLFAIGDVPPGDPAPPLPRDVWLPDIQVMVARDSAGSDAGFFVAAKGGHNAESHNHNDVGSFIVYLDGRPLLVDAGVEIYTAKTFGPDRYSIWTMRSVYHTLLPEIDGHEQRAGLEFAARDVRQSCDDRAARLELDIAGAWPPEAGIRLWRREVVLERGVRVAVTDRYDLSRAPGQIEMSILTPCSVDIGTAGVIRLGERATVGDRPTAAGTLTCDPAVFSPAVEEIELADERMRSTWGARLTRVVLSARSPAQAGSFRFEVGR